MIKIKKPALSGSFDGTWLQFTYNRERAEALTSTVGIIACKSDTSQSYPQAKIQRKDLWVFCKKAKKGVEFTY